MSGITLKEVGGDLVIDVLQESTVIGRGQFLQITDKRVSRSHALLEVKEGKLYITPTHTNPCFLRAESAKEQSVLTRDVKHLLHNGDEFGLLPDQLFYRVLYPQFNGKDSEALKETKKLEDLKPEESSTDQPGGIKPEAVSNGGSEPEKDGDTAEGKVLKEEDEPQKAKVSSEKDVNNEEEKESKTNQKEEPTGERDEEEDKKEEKDGDEEEEEGRSPVDKKRVLPAWMVKVAHQDPSPKEKASPKKPTSVAVNKRAPGMKLTKPEEDDDDDDLDEEKDVEEDDDDEDYTPQKRGKGRLGKQSDDDYEEEASDEDYTPEKRGQRGRGGGRGRKKRKDSDSEDDDFSDDDDDYSPRKTKSKLAKRTPKGKGKKKTPSKMTPARGSRTATPRSRTKRKVADDDDDEEELLPRRRGGDDDDEDEELPSRRPQRAAKQKRGSYVDDPLIEEALEDFAASEEEVLEDKDSDFEVEGMEDSGSDWERSNSQKQKVSKVRGKAPARPTSRRGATKAKKGRRSSRAIDSDDDEDDDIMEDDEPYVPRPSKRRGGLLSHDTESDEEGDKKRRRRELCQYGKKCYRKNPVHFRTYCHPGDSSYDDDKDDHVPKEAKKEKDSGKASPPKPSRPQRSTAGTKLVTHGAEDDDLPDTYDYQDSFIDDGTQPSEGDAEDDSDYDAEEDIRGLAKEAKAFVRAKKK